MERTDSKSLSESVVKENPRAYGCPCGKAYLSYPALFTHVKQKHDGKVKILRFSLQVNWLNQKVAKFVVDQRQELMYLSCNLALRWRTQWDYDESIKRGFRSYWKLVC